MMPITIQLALSWMGVILVLVLIYFFVIIRVIRYYTHFPIPSCAVRLIDNPIRRQIQPPHTVVDWIDIHEGMRVLEIGPGSGTFTVEAAARAGRGILIALDIQKAVVSTLMKRLSGENVTVNVVPIAASVYELPFQPRTFDRVFMITVLAEIPHRKKALHEISRVLNDDGLLAVGEFLPDPDYPRRKTVVKWCADAGFEVTGEHGGILSYVLNFAKAH